MKIMSVKDSNPLSFEGRNRKNIIISILVVIFLISALLLGIYNYTTIQELNEDLKSTNIELTNTINSTNEDISSLNSTNNRMNDTIIGLQEDVSLLNQSNIELIAQNDFLLNQPQSYDFFIFFRFNGVGSKIVVKSGLSNNQEFETSSLFEALLYAFSNDAKIVTMKSGNYVLDSDIYLESKSNIIFEGKNSVVDLNNHTIVFGSDNHLNNSNNQIRNFIFRDGTLKFENSFKATVENVNFKDCESALELSNTNTWTEFTRIVNVFWNNCKTCLTFESPLGNATGSYENTLLDSCSMNLLGDNSVGILVEKGAHFSNSQIINSRVWMYANSNQTQTGIYSDGVMTNTQNSVVFESFGDGTIYGVYLDENSEGFSEKGTVFLGNAFIKNLNYAWIPGGLFRVDPLTLTLGKSLTIFLEYVTIESFDGIIDVENLNKLENETVTVHIKLNFKDSTSSPSTLQLSFNDNTTYSLSPNDLYELYPPQNVIQNIEVVAYSNLINSQANVTFRVLGTIR